MQHQSSQFTDRRGASIYTQSWLPDGPTRAALVVVHGLGEHSGRYGNLVDQLAPRGYATYGFDLPGHGRSSGQRLYVERFGHYTDTLGEVVGQVQREQPRVPLFLLGHSMGGLIAAAYLCASPQYTERQSQLAGAILSAPSVSVPDDISPLVLLASKALSAIVPQVGVKKLVEPSWLSHDPQVVRAYVDDPLVTIDKVTARLGAELLAAQERVMLAAASIRLPILVIQGGNDRVVAPGGVDKLYRAVRSPDKSIRLYDGLFHECMNEPECADVLNDIQNWLDAHLDHTTPHAE